MQKKGITLQKTKQNNNKTHTKQTKPEKSTKVPTFKSLWETEKQEIQLIPAIVMWHRMLFVKPVLNHLRFYKLQAFSYQETYRQLEKCIIRLSCILQV